MNARTSCVCINRNDAVETHIFASHGLKHLLQLNSELLDVVDDDTRLRGGDEKHHTRFSHPFLFFLYPFFSQLSGVSCN